jgi:hypothetical protein
MGNRQAHLGSETKQQFIDFFSVSDNADGTQTISLDAGGWSICWRMVNKHPRKQ